LRDRRGRLLQRIHALNSARSEARRCSADVGTSEHTSQDASKSQADGRANGGDEHLVQRRNRSPGRERKRRCVPDLFRQRCNQLGNRIIEPARRHHKLQKDVASALGDPPPVARDAAIWRKVLNAYSNAAGGSTNAGLVAAVREADHAAWRWTPSSGTLLSCLNTNQ
jgi:hypothetical protein